MSLVPTDQPRDLALPGALTESQIDTLRRTIAHDLTNDELDLFAAVCRRTGLDPFAKQIYAIKRTSRRKVRGDWVEEQHLTIQTGIDGFRLAAQRSTLYAGQDAPEWCGPDGVWTDVWLSDEPPAAARVAVYRKDFARPVVGVAKFDSYADRWPPKDGQVLGDLRNLWKSMPEQMIAKCAEALALRKAFPNDLSGIYTTEEMEQANAPIDVHGGERRGIPAEQFREIVAASETLSPDQIAELQSWRDAEGLVIKPQDLTQEDARRVMERIVELGRGGGGGDEPVSGSAAAPPPPENAGGEGSEDARSGAEQAQAASPQSPASADATGGDEPQVQHPSGGVTAEQLLELVTGAPATRKGKVQRAGVSVAQALGLPVPTSIDDVIADQALAVAVLADLRGDDKPPPPGSGGGQDPAVGEQPPAQAPGSGPAPADPAPTAAPDPVPLKTEHRSDWGKENAYCQAVAAEHLSGDPDTLKAQREALAYQASGGRVTSWSEVTRLEFSQIRSWLSYIADGHGRLVESNAAADFGWAIRIEEAA